MCGGSDLCRPGRGLFKRLKTKAGGAPQGRSSSRTRAVAVEIEAKMKLTDPQPLIARLTDVGAARGASVVEHNTYFDTPDGSLKAADRGLRLRVEREVDTQDQEIIITYKGPRAAGEVKSRQEIELVVADAQAARELIAALGFAAVRSFEKHRQHWRYQGCEIDIDTLPLLGRFVEIEGPSEQQVLAVREKLGLSSLPLIRESYIAMLETYVQQHGIKGSHLSLESGRGGKP